MEKVIKVRFVTDYETIGNIKRSGYLFEYQDKKETCFTPAKDNLYDTVGVTTINQMVNLSMQGYKFIWG